MPYVIIGLSVLLVILVCFWEPRRRSVPFMEELRTLERDPRWNPVALRLERSADEILALPVADFVPKVRETWSFNPVALYRDLIGEGALPHEIGCDERFRYVMTGGT